jgi:hypothetical protein
MGELKIKRKQHKESFSYSKMRNFVRSWGSEPEDGQPEVSAYTLFRAIS